MLESDQLLNPQLRPVEAFPVRTNGQDLVCLRDPENFAENPIFLNKMMVFLVSRMDGKHSLRDIQADYFRATSEILPIETLESLVSQLEEQHYLASPAFEKSYQGLVEEFQSLPTRPARHAGSAYQETCDALVAQIESYFAHQEGPGNGSNPEPATPLRGLISPHIDFARGGPTYAHAYHALSRHPGADTFIIFGTCHTRMSQRFSIASKDYETPLGTAKTDKEFVARLSAKLKDDYRDEFCHRGEHSIEFQAVCLQYLMRGKQDYRIVPILVGSFHDIYEARGKAADDPEVLRVVTAIRETIEESSGRVCIVAGADLAHVGRRFGDSSGPTGYSLREVECQDRSFLQLVVSGDAEAVFDSIAADGDSRRVCGCPPIYMTLRCIDQPRGKLLQYRQWSDLQAGAAVTYAAVALF
jgi:AmmeMemoRadiSam system protein B